MAPLMRNVRFEPRLLSRFLAHSVPAIRKKRRRGARPTEKMVGPENQVKEMKSSGEQKNESQILLAQGSKHFDAKRSDKIIRF